MDTVRICKQCRQPLSEDTPEGLCPPCQAKVASNLEPAAPETRIPPEVAELAPYFPLLEIVELLGMGGMGMVYKARQPKLDRLVALKILPLDSPHHPYFAERFNREAKALAKLNHPGIVDIYEFGQTGPYYYFVMEYVDGLDLRELLCNQTVTPHQTLELVVQICTALQYAHDEGVVHRDIKPANILVNKKGQAKIADFGLAKLLGATPDTALTTSQAAMGTVNYMAPEQRENAQSVDHRADIYSLGVVFYEMLTGEVPMGRFEAPSKKAQIDARLDEVVLRALERDPARRYQKASEVRSEVEAITHIPAAGIGGKPPRAALPRLLLNWPGWVLAFVLVVGLILEAGGWLGPLAVSLMDFIVPPTTEQRVERAKKSLVQYDLEGHIKNAIHQLQLAKDTASPNAELTETRAWLGLAYWRNYKDTQSIEERTKAATESALVTNKDSGLAYLVQGLVALDEGTNLLEAVRLFKRAKDLSKEDNCEALVGLANAHFGLHDSTNAARYFEAARTVGGKSWNDWLNLGLYFFNKEHNSEAALTNFQEALNLTQNGSPLAWRNRGNVLLYLNSTNEALQACNESLKRRKTAEAYYLRGYIFYVENDWQSAAESFLVAAETRRTTYWYWGYAGLALLHLTNQQAEAMEDLGKAVERAEDTLVDKPDCLIRAREGLYRACLGQTNEADLCLRQALGQCPNDSRVLDAAMEAYTTLNDKAQADPLIQQTLDQSPGDRSVMERAIVFYRQLGETEKETGIQKQLDKKTH